MSQISDLRKAAQTRGQELVKEHQELMAKAKQIENEVTAINGEISAYNKIEPPNEDAPNKAPDTEG